jgi:hypothetical protein
VEAIEESLKRSIRHETDEETQRQRDNTEGKRYPPLTPANPSHLEGSTTDENNQYLDANFCEAEEVNIALGKIEWKATSRLG